MAIRLHDASGRLAKRHNYEEGGKMRGSVIVRRMLLALPLLAAASQAVAGGACGEATAIRLLNHFYAIGGNPGNVPSQRELAAREFPFSESLNMLFMDAAMYRDSWMEAHPPEPSVDGSPPVVFKPPFVDGDLFTGMVDGATEFGIGEVMKKPGHRWEIEVRSPGTQFMSPWVVYVSVVEERGECVIDEVTYESRSSGSTLSQALKERW